jgi:hypothetical protein
MSDLRNGACPLALESLAQTGDSRRTLFYSRTDFAAGNCTGPASACRNVRKLYPGRRVIARLFAARTFIAISMIIFRKMASAKVSKSRATIMNAPGPPITFAL